MSPAMDNGDEEVCLFVLSILWQHQFTVNPLRSTIKRNLSFVFHSLLLLHMHSNGIDDNFRTTRTEQHLTFWLAKQSLLIDDMLRRVSFLYTWTNSIEPAYTEPQSGGLVVLRFRSIICQSYNNFDCWECLKLSIFHFLFHASEHLSLLFWNNKRTYSLIRIKGLWIWMNVSARRTYFMWMRRIFVVE